MRSAIIPVGAIPAAESGWFFGRRKTKSNVFNKKLDTHEQKYERCYRRGTTSLTAIARGADDAYTAERWHLRDWRRGGESKAVQNSSVPGADI